jgi:hypothetical protein
MPSSFFRAAAVVAAAFIAAPVLASVPSLCVPACPVKGTIQYDKSVPKQTHFPLTQVDVCYDDEFIRLTFRAYNETNFYFNASQETNDYIFEYEVMEAFISRGTDDPQTYFEFEVNPNNVTFQAFIYNPSKVRAEGATFNGALVTEPLADGLVARTTLDKPNETWTSSARIPLGFFNVDKGQAKGTQWRMNFFRTVVAPETFPDQLLGAWSPPDEPNFHNTPFFGNVLFI